MAQETTKTVETTTKRIVLDLPEELYWGYKKILAERQQKSTKVIREFIEEYVNQGEE